MTNTSAQGAFLPDQPELIYYEVNSWISTSQTLELNH